MKILSNIINHTSSSASQLFFAVLFLSFQGKVKQAEAARKNERKLENNFDYSEAQKIDGALLREVQDVGDWRVRYNVNKYGC
jgi:hypothetical protein